MSFKKETEEDQVHIEIDGEFYKIEQPQSLYIQQHEEFIEGKINILVLQDKEAKHRKIKFEAKPINFEARTKILEKKLKTEIIDLGKKTGIVDLNMLKSLNTEPQFQ
jgi:hypothetical protein